jgi:hypothetical protein
MLKKLVTTFAGDPTRKVLKKYLPVVERINALEKEYEGFSDEALRAQTDAFRRRLATGETLDDILPEAFAVVREASKRTIGLRHYDVQLIGGVVLHEGKVAAQVIAGQKSFFDARTIPSVAYTDPEIAWCGLTEEQAKEQGIEYEKGAFPWAASGRALSMGASNGLTKVLFDKETKRVIGAGIVGKNAGELIAEAVLALEMGADAEDLGLTIHPHPTLSETINFAAEMAEGTITDLYIPKK